MFYGNTIEDSRTFFFISWNKHKEKQPLSTLEQQIVAVILEHPEYHPILDKELSKSKNFLPELGESNPFLHMGLHLALRDQIKMNRPLGILNIYNQLIENFKDSSLVEHLMMDCLAQCLFDAQKNHTLPNEDHYFNTLNHLIESK